MRVLIVETEPRVADEVAHMITEAGHTITACHDPSWLAFPCVGMDATCPLDGGVDVVVVVRNRDNPTVSPLEDGARCAVRAGLPMVVIGSDWHNPFEQWATKTLPMEHADQVVAAIEAVAAEPDQRLSEIATAALTETLGNARVDTTGATATVRRTPERGLDVRISVPGTSDTSAARRASVWVASTLRREAGLTGTIDVSVGVDGECETAESDLPAPRSATPTPQGAGQPSSDTPPMMSSV